MMKFRFYTLSQYHQEERWLEKMAQNGWLLKNAVLPGFYFFRKAKPENMLYRFDYFASKSQRNDAIALYEEYGWKYIFTMNGFVLFAHPNDGQADQQIFSSEEDRKGMILRIIKARMIPITILMAISLILLIYQLFKGSSKDFADGFTMGFTCFVSVLTVLCWYGLIKDWKSVSRQ